ncbi:MAG: type II toxin-antitoxin system HicB family antitoxin [Patescibacteria group bacterium]
MNKTMTPVLRYNAVFESCDEGGFTVTVPKLPGLVTEGNTYEKALANVQDAIAGYLLVLNEAGEDLPDPDEKVFTTPVDFKFTGAGFAVC